MITFTQAVPSTSEAQHRVALSYHQRIKGRLRITTAEGVEAGILIERGQLLDHGDKLASDSGDVLLVQALDEPVSVATAESDLLFARACYHVGNRHAEVQIESNRLVYLHDHVMDKMLVQLGLDVTSALQPFCPENGAYSGGHSHSHAHDDQEEHLHHHEH